MLGKISLISFPGDQIVLLHVLFLNLVHSRSGICGLSIQRAPSTAQSTPRATPHPPAASPLSDVVRIHVTYNPLAASPSRLHPVSSTKYRYSDDHHKPSSLGLGFYATNGTNIPPDNRIRIQVPSEELLTPVVDSGRIISQRYFESHSDMYDLK